MSLFRRRNHRAPPSQGPDGKWKQPSVVLSGTVDLPSTRASPAHTLNVKLVSPRIGAASTLKLSFAALTKGLTALSILSVSTVQTENPLPELLGHLDEYSPHTAALARTGVAGMSPKAYRWVEEMHGIGEGFDREDGWVGVGSQIYGGMAEIYRTVAEETILGQERVEARERGIRGCSSDHFGKRKHDIEGYVIGEWTFAVPSFPLPKLVIRGPDRVIGRNSTVGQGRSGVDTTRTWREQDLRLFILISFCSSSISGSQSSPSNPLHLVVLIQPLSSYSEAVKHDRPTTARDHDISPFYQIID